MTITSRPTEVEDLLRSLVEIESVTPWLIPGADGERAIAEWIARWLEDLPVEVTMDEVEPGRINLVARLRGTGGGPTLCLNAHVDTVGHANWRERALLPERRDDNLIGLGAADDKSGVVVALLVLRDLATSGQKLRGDLLVGLVCDEEGASIGTSDLVKRHTMDAAIVIEPDGMGRVCVEHQGFGWVDVIVHGKPAHGCVPEEGIDAIVRMAEVIRSLNRRDVEVFQAGDVPFNGRTVFHTGTIKGGTDYATYPGQAVLGIEIGTQPGEHLADRVREIEETFEEVRGIFPDFKGEVRVALEREPFVAAGHETLLAALDRASRAVIGRPHERVGMNGWADSAMMQGAGIPTIMIGPGGGNWHAPDEWVSLSEIAQVREMVRLVAEDFLA
jgi:acetylornithine deacetylase/succinyl-diaminopimelate desuccinylase-like protein